VPDVGLDVEASRREPRTLHAYHKSFRALVQQAEGGLVWMPRFRAVDHVVQAPVRCRSLRELVRKVRARRQLRATAEDGERRKRE
jgi:hypothetical protein